MVFVTVQNQNLDEDLEESFDIVLVEGVFDFDAQILSKLEIQVRVQYLSLHCKRRDLPRGSPLESEVLDRMQSRCAGRIGQSPLPRTATPATRHCKLQVTVLCP